MSDLHVGATARELVPGDPDEVERLGARLGLLATGLGTAGAQLRLIHAGEWIGPAADAFDAVVDQEPARYEAAAAAFSTASQATAAFAAVLATAQDQARLAIDIFEEAATATDRWRGAVERFESVSQSADRGDVGAMERLGTMDRPPSADPGAEGRRRAEELLADAREWVSEAGREAARLLEEACDGAPDEPSLIEQAAGRLWYWGREFVGGAVEATVDLGQFVWSVSNLRLVIDPEGWQRDAHALAEGLWFGINHPTEFAQAVLDWDTWAESPARALGHLVPDAILAVTTAGAGTPGVVIRRIALAATVATRLRDASQQSRGLDESDPLLTAALDPNVDIGRITPTPVWRSTNEPLYRADDRPPELVFEEGFAPRDMSNLDLRVSVPLGGASAFVSTTRSDRLIFDWQTQYWYHVDAPGGIDVNATLGDHRYSFEDEVAFPGGIDRRFIVGAQPYDPTTGRLGEIIPNPYYDPVP